MSGRRKQEAADWYRQALHDLRAARWNAEGGFYNTACFLAQQAAEKALKSIVYFQGLSRKKLLTHSVFELLRIASRAIPKLEDYEEEARLLDLHYIPSRYPNGLVSGFPHQFYGKDTASRAISAASKILEQIRLFYDSRGFPANEEEF